MGKGGGALSMWLKEFGALVFTQTIQAFIYAIIISVILFGMVNQSPDMPAADSNASLGLMATFALLSVFKVEELTKKIFGIHDTKASPGQAVRSLAKGAIAFSLGKKLLNNVGKISGGYRQMHQARRDRKKLASRLEEDMRDNGYVLQNGKPVKVASTSKSSTTTNTSTDTGKKPMSDKQKEYYEKAKAAKAAGNMEGYRYNMGIAAGIGKSEVDVGDVSVSSEGGNDLSGASYRRIKNALRTYEDKAAEITKSRNEGIKTMISGTVESIAAIPGAVTGMVLKSPTGDFSEMLSAGITGAGVGDMVGKSLVDTVDKATKLAQRVGKNETGMIFTGSGYGKRQLQKSIDRYKDALSKASVNHNNSKIDIDNIDI